MSYILLEQPFTAAQCRTAKNQCIDGIVSVDLSDIIVRDLEGFLDLLENKMLGDLGTLTDLEYTVVGNGMYDILHIRVAGFVTLTEDM